MITAGIDCGARNTKTVILKDGEIAGKGVVLTGFDLEKAAEISFEKAMEARGLARKAVEKICGTGSGRSFIKIADMQVEDINAITKAAICSFPGSRTVLDVGAEEGMAARIDEQGKVLDFVVSERCAAGTGLFVESMATALETTVEEMGPLALKSDKKIPMNAQCAVFAESEVVGLIHAGTEVRDISRAIHEAMVDRLVSMVRRIGVEEGVVMMGGVANNPAIVELVQRELHLENLLIPDDPEFGAAHGAALIAAEKAGR